MAKPKPGDGGGSGQSTSTGSGGTWLAKYLYAKGLRGNQLAWAWAIAMRESGGRPGIDNRGLNPNGSVDYGLFQINNRAHADKLRRRGWTEEDLRDPDKNFQIFMEISRNGKDYGAWGIANPDGSVSGWARHVQRTSPSDFARFRAGFDSQMRQWGERYAGQYGGTSSATGAASAATQQAVDISREESLRMTNPAAWQRGHSSYGAIEWALNEMNSEQKDYSGLCDHFVGRAYGFAHSGFADAATHWAQSPDKHRNGDPPPGTLVFWTGGSKGHGHVAISLGGGFVASTDILRSGQVDVVSIDYINSRWGNLNYQGWANPYFNGQTIKPAQTDAELNARINYAVRESQRVSPGDSTVGASVPDTASDTSTSTRAATDKPDSPIPDANNNGKVDEIDYARLARDYGLTYKMMKENPELAKLIERAVDKEWDEYTFRERVMSSTWYRTHSSVWREIEALRLSDPASYGRRIAAEARNAKDYASRMGVTISEKQANEIAYKALHYAWTEAEYRNYLAPMLKPGATGFYLGEAGSYEEQLKRLAYQNGVTMGDDFYAKAVQSIAAGDRVLGDWEDYIRKNAATMFPVFKDDIMAGVDVRSLAGQYLSTMANTLDVNVDSIGLDDPWMMKALNGRDPEGKPSAMGLYQFQRELKSDPRYATTTNAMNEMAAAMTDLGRIFGFYG